MTDKKQPQRKEIAQGIEGKYATDPRVKDKKQIIPKKCGGSVKRKK